MRAEVETLPPVFLQLTVDFLRTTPPVSDSPNSSAGGFTGRSRRKTTRASVRFGDTFSRLLITAGGIGTIVSVLTVALLLFVVVLPLFTGADADEETTLELAPGESIVAIGVDEYLTTAWQLSADGVMTIRRYDDGTKLREVRLVDASASPTVWSWRTGSPLLIAGFDDGSVRTWASWGWRRELSERRRRSPKLFSRWKLEPRGERALRGRGTARPTRRKPGSLRYNLPSGRYSTRRSTNQELQR